MNNSFLSITDDEGRLAGLRVLIVEDEYFIAEELRDLLSARGVEILGPTATPARALSLLAASDVDCAVLDIDLNGRAIFPVVEELRRRNLPWIYVTGYTRSLIPKSMRGHAHIEKPVPPDALVAALARLPR